MHEGTTWTCWLLCKLANEFSREKFYTSSAPFGHRCEQVPNRQPNCEESHRRPHNSNNDFLLLCNQSALKARVKTFCDATDDIRRDCTRHAPCVLDSCISKVQHFSCTYVPRMAHFDTESVMKSITYAPSSQMLALIPLPPGHWHSDPRGQILLQIQSELVQGLKSPQSLIDVVALLHRCPCHLTVLNSISPATAGPVLLVTYFNEKTNSVGNYLNIVASVLMRQNYLRLVTACQLQKTGEGGATYLDPMIFERRGKSGSS